MWKKKLKFYFGQKNSDLKNNTLWKRNYCVSEMKIQKKMKNPFWIKKSVI